MHIENDDYKKKYGEGSEQHCKIEDPHPQSFFAASHAIRLP